MDMGHRSRFLSAGGGSVTKFVRARNDVVFLDRQQLATRNAADASRERRAKKLREQEAEQWIAEVRARTAAAK